MARPEARGDGRRLGSAAAAGLAAALTASVLGLSGSAPPDRVPLAGWAGRTFGLSPATVACIRRELPAQAGPWADEDVARRGVAALPAADQQVAGDVIVACAIRAAGR